MFRWFTVCLLLAAGTVFLVAALSGRLTGADGPKPDKGDKSASSGEAGEHVRRPLPERSAPPDGRSPQEKMSVDWPAKSPVAGKEQGQYIIANHAHLQATEKQETPAEQEGKLVFLGVELKPEELRLVEELRKQGKPLPHWYIEAELGFLAVEVHEGEKVPADQLVKFDGVTKVYRRWNQNGELIPGQVVVARQTKKFRKLEIGMQVEQGQLLALVNPALAMDDLAVKNATLQGAQADFRASEKTRDEAYRLYLVKERTKRDVGGSVANDELQAAKLSWHRYTEEARAKNQAIHKAQSELSAAMTKLKLHEIRASIPGVVKVIYKSRGDAVKGLDAVLQIQNPNLLVAQGEIEAQDRAAVAERAEVIVEPSQPDGPRAVLEGHLGEITAVAVSKDPNPYIVSASTDGTVRVWEREAAGRRWHQRGKLTHGVPVRAVACTPPGAARNLILSGTSTGLGQLFDLADMSKGPRPLKDRHKGAINCVAFSPDGKTCATAGEDRDICLWDTASGERIHRIQLAHKGVITSLQFASKSRLISASQDGVLVVWDVEGAPRQITDFERSGDVAQVGASPDGTQVLIDQGKELQVLSVADKQIVGTLQSPASESNFTTMALFSPKDGKTILTNGGGPGQLQLWRAPADGRASQVRQLVWTSGAATCGAFAPDNTFIVTGTHDNKVLVWKMPGDDEISATLKGRVLAVGNSLDSKKVSIRVELVNPGWLLPGGTATLVIPRKPLAPGR